MMNCNHQTISVYVMIKQRISALGVQNILASEKDIEVIVLPPKYAGDLKRICDFRPDVVVTDVETCSRQSPDVIADIRKDGNTKFLFVYSPAADSTSSAVKMGADGLVAKSSPACALGAAVRSLASGRVWIDESIWRNFLNMDHRTVAPVMEEPIICDGYTTKLSNNELEVLRLASQGLSNKEIAQTLEVSIDTVKCYIWLITKKLRARGRTHAINVAKQAGIFS